MTKTYGGVFCISAEDLYGQQGLIRSDRLSRNTNALLMKYLPGAPYSGRTHKGEVRAMRMVVRGVSRQNMEAFHESMMHYDSTSQLLMDAYRGHPTLRGCDLFYKNWC